MISESARGHIHVQDFVGKWNFKLEGGASIAAEGRFVVAGGHTVDDPEPKYGMAVTGLADPDRLLRNDAGRAGVPLSLTKPLGIGMLNCRHKNTGEVSREARVVTTRQCSGIGLPRRRTPQ